MQSIQVTQETYRKIERLARPFKDRTEEDVVRRLADAALEGGLGAEDPDTGLSSRSDLIIKGGNRIRHGTALEGTYKGTEYGAEVRDGKVWWDGKPYSSPRHVEALRAA